MLVISLDEGGKFEFDSRHQAPHSAPFIGGVIYKQSNDDTRKELMRLKRFFETACENQCAQYPYDLHYNWEGSKVVNGDAASRVKEELETNIADFMLGRGAWSNDRPVGEYYFYVLLSDGKGFEDRTANSISNLLNDNLAANRYEHMAYRAIENVLFYNPVVTDNTIKLELATRSLSSEQTDPNFSKLGIEKNKESDTYSITNSTGYRSVIANALLADDCNGLDIDLKVQSINYKQGNHNLYQGFLYLADTVCSIFANALGGVTKLEALMEEAYKRGAKLLPDRTLVYAYSKVDQIYRNAYTATKRGDYFEALYTIKACEINHIPCHAYYNAHWFRHIENRITCANSSEGLYMALQRLDLFLDDRSRYNQIIAEYLIHVLCQQVKQLGNNEVSKKLQFLLYKSQMRIFNHGGRYKNTIDLYEKCLSVAQYSHVEDFLELRNIYCVALQDSLQNAKALQFAKQTLEYEEFLTDVKKDIYPQNEQIFIHVHYGRSCSQYAQVLSNASRFDEATDYFEKALTAFGDDIEERTFTLSLYLHALIENGDRQKYEEYAKEYFGTSDIKRQIDQINVRANGLPKFMLYVYVKALYVFFRRQLSKKELAAIVKKIETFYKEEPDAHPWEIIFKYCAFIILHNNGNTPISESDRFIKLAADAITNPKDGIIGEILEENMREYQGLSAGKTIDELFAETQLNYMYR